MHLVSRFLRPLLAGAAWAASVLACGAAPATVAPQDFLPQVGAQLAAHFATTGELQLELLRAWKAPVAPAGDWEMVVVSPPPALANQMIVRVRLTAGGTNLGEWNLPLEGHLWGDALITRQPVARGASIESSCFELRRVDFLHEKDAIPAGTDLSGHAMARGLPVGTVLSWREVAPRLLVQRGSRVEVVAVSGALTITMKGLAMQSGARGETIVVRNPESRRDFSAVVVGENQARITF